jgi:hypothetical protein
MLDKNYGIKLDPDTLAGERKCMAHVLEPVVKEPNGVYNPGMKEAIEDCRNLSAADLLSIQLGKASVSWRNYRESGLRSQSGAGELPSALMAATYITASIEVMDKLQHVWARNQILIGERRLYPKSTRALSEAEAKYIEQVDKVLAFAAEVVKTLQKPIIGMRWEYRVAEADRVRVAIHLAAVAINVVEHQDGRSRYATGVELYGDEGTYLGRWYETRNKLKLFLADLERQLAEGDKKAAALATKRVR